MKRFGLFIALALGVPGCMTSIGEPVVTRGTTGATAIFEAGLGDGAESWARLRSSLPATQSSFAWNRAGYGGLGLFDFETWPSDQDGQRTGSEVAAQLRRELNDQGIPPPYILVGHSLGGTYTLSFAKAYPELVAGIVLVDARLPGFTAHCQSMRLSNCTPPAALLALMGETERAELRGMAETEASLGDLSFLNDLPVTVMSAGKRGVGISAEYQAAWINYARTFAERLPGGRHVHVQKSGHYIHQQATDAVANEVMKLTQ